ncbi:D-amino acid aminotransferase [Halorhodospira neutriphila]|uniref:D-amino acid aminotransferase n=1 Tax=Halorhodospira neutriphila TaxID=168379 RepID=A0ABS1E2Y8_9GAMM|nr:D-amino acid aminotransferase [Halorhodospira neutriphila]MBK1726141.1 D-amino acid aminotransferase [Halorhodospira neutriphila]
MGQPSTCYLNGEMLPLEQARISPLDRGFLFGDGVYELLPVYAGVPFRLADHLRRLRRSLEAVRIPSPLSDAEWGALLERLCRANGGGDLAVYIQVTRGSPGQRSHEFPAQTQPTVFAMASALPPRGAYARGVAAVTAEDPRWSRCDIKAVSLLPNVLLRQQAVDAGAYEAILHRDGLVTEGAASTVFTVRDGVLATPRLHEGLLPGVTREVILELAERHGLAYQRRPIAVEELAEAQEIWLSSSSKEVLPVVSLDGRPVGDGRPGEAFAAMRGWFDALRAEVEAASATGGMR